MPGFLLSLARIGSYRSLLHAAAGVAIAVPVTPFALAAAVSVAADSRVRALLALAVLMGLLGLLGPVRRLGIGLANTLLGTSVPAPESRPLPLALISVLVGCAGLPLGAWTIPFGLVAAFAALALTAATFGLRAGATALLGPSAAERVAHAERRAAAAELVEADPAQVRRALGTIEEASRTALEDLDHVLGLLREEPAAKEPARTPAEVDVRVEAGPERLAIAVVNALPGVDPRRGLAGLAERVEARRGQPQPGRGHRVRSRRRPAGAPRRSITDVLPVTSVKP
jgi:hypothetical protein